MIEGLGAQLKLDDRQRQPSAQTLYTYGVLSWVPDLTVLFVGFESCACI